MNTSANVVPDPDDRTRVIVLALKAGGTAKTSSCTSIGCHTALRGYRTLVIDLDPQGNATRVLGRHHIADGQPDVIEVMKDNAELKDAILSARYRVDPDDDTDEGYEQIPNLFVAPMNVLHPDNDETEVLLQKQDTGMWLQDSLAEVVGDYDLVLIDCPANYGRVTVTALNVLDDTVDGEVLPPVLCTFKEAEALTKLEAKLAQLREDRGRRRRKIEPRTRKVLACATPTATFGRQEHRESLQELQDEYGDLLLPLVHWSGHVPRIFRDECPLPILAPNSRGAQDYAKVTTALGFPKKG